ncbi:hypothetical protein OTU49_000831 [Cherax quadricarinatus]|uniref:Cuticle protein n=1 Tax=Cherax quadricarinatus TaxID=27406 RepID=A0AAW0XYT9_CHEQU
MIARLKVLFALVAVAAARPQTIALPAPLVTLKTVSGSPSEHYTASYSNLGVIPYPFGGLPYTYSAFPYNPFLVPVKPTEEKREKRSADAEPEADPQVLLYHSQFAPGAFPYTAAPGAFPYTAYSAPYTYTVPAASSKFTVPLVTQASIPSVYSTISPYSGIYHSAAKLTLPYITPYTGLYPHLSPLVVNPQIKLEKKD